MHNWKLVDTGVFHAFHHHWITAISSALNAGLLPPGPRDPGGVHAAIWAEVRDEPFALPVDEALTLVAYESGLTTRAYIEPASVGDPLPDMPLFLEPDGYIPVPLESTCRTAFDGLPSRWRTVLEPSA